MAAAERRLTGVAASDGVVVGPVRLLADVEAPAGGSGGPGEQARALAALQTVAARLGAASERLRAAGRDDVAEIVAASQLMAEDPGLLAEVETLAVSQPAAAAILAATERQAALLAAIPDPHLAGRAADVRRLGRQAARIALAGAAGLPPGPDVGVHPRESPVVLVARDLGPTDLAEVELEGLLVGGIALAEGSATSHAAIVARSLGVPLVVGLGDGVLALREGALVALDGTAGLLVAAPTDDTLRSARAAFERQQRRRAELARTRARGAVTADGQPVRLLVNASTEREVRAGLAAGAEGVGLLRTELAFLDASDWPSAEAHAAALRPIFRQVAGRTVTVRTLDFGADKTPPFLRGRVERGIALQLGTPGALAAQLEGLLRAADQAGAGAGLRVMLPLVANARQMVAAREVLREVRRRVVRATGLDVPLPPLGAMIESVRAVERCDEIAAVADFLSIGTNDLAAELLGLDRLTPTATVRAAADPRVLRAIRDVTDAACRHGRSLEVCGEAAGDPRIAVLLLGLGVAELSVAPARLDEVRAAIQAATRTGAVDLVERALTCDSAAAVLALGAATEPPGSCLRDEENRP